MLVHGVDQGRDGRARERGREQHEAEQKGGTHPATVDGGVRLASGEWERSDTAVAGSGETPRAESQNQRFFFR
jgi:hypothetical protein